MCSEITEKIDHLQTFIYKQLFSESLGKYSQQRNCVLGSQVRVVQLYQAVHVCLNFANTCITFLAASSAVVVPRGVSAIHLVEAVQSVLLDLLDQAGRGWFVWKCLLSHKRCPSQLSFQVPRRIASSCGASMIPAWSRVIWGLCLVLSVLMRSTFFPNSTGGDDSTNWGDTLSSLSLPVVQEEALLFAPHSSHHGEFPPSSFWWAHRTRKRWSVPEDPPISRIMSRPCFSSGWPCAGYSV